MDQGLYPTYQTPTFPFPQGHPAYFCPHSTMLHPKQSSVLALFVMSLSGWQISLLTHAFCVHFRFRNFGELG